MMGVAGTPFTLLSSMYALRPTSTRATSFTRTMALPFGFARRMISSYSEGLRKGPGSRPGTSFAPFVAWLLTDLAGPRKGVLLGTALLYVGRRDPMEAIRSGFIPIRIAWSGTPKIWA